MNTISSRIVSSIIICSVIIAISIGGLSLIAASRIIKDETNEKFSYLSKNQAHEFNTIISDIESSVNSIIAVVRSSFDINEFRSNSEYQIEYMKTVDKVVKEIGKDVSGIQGVYFTVNPELTGSVFSTWYIDDGEGNLIYQEPEHISEYYPDNEDMEWYYSPLDNKQGVWTPPYVDATINVKMISFTKALYLDQTLIGVIGMDVSFDDIQRIIEKIKLNDTGYGFLFDDEYNFLVHPSVEEGTNLLDLENEAPMQLVTPMEENTSGVIEYVFRDEDKIMGYSRLRNNWILGVVSTSDEIFEPVTVLRNKISLIVFTLIFFTGILGVIISKSITSSIDKLRSMAIEISKGNHNILIDLDTNDEMGELAKSFNVMTRELMNSHTELKDMSDELEYLAYHDPLTTLPNRRFGKSKLKAVIDNDKYEKHITGIMFIDIDDFKSINDTLGHDVGDELLIEVARIMNHCVRKHDTVFRLGGDEFMIIFNSMPSLELIVDLANRLLASLSEPIQINDNQLNISCSIGISIIGEHGEDVKTIMKNADIALYEAKESGKNTYKFYTSEK